MLLKSNYIKYDILIEEYFINTDCITNYTNYSSSDLNAVGIDDKALKAISHSVYRLIYSNYFGANPYNHKRFMRKKIYLNQQGEVISLLLAMVEAVKGAVESGMDLNAYIDNPKNIFPKTVFEELKSSKLLDASEKINYLLDFTYTNADRAVAQ